VAYQIVRLTDKLLLGKTTYLHKGIVTFSNKTMYIGDRDQLGGGAKGSLTLGYGEIIAHAGLLGLTRDRPVDCVAPQGQFTSYSTCNHIWFLTTPLRVRFKATGQFWL
jgi:hypothetical protein